MKWAKALVFNFVIRTVFERIPVLKNLFAKVDGKKTIIGRIIVYISILSFGLSQVFPEIPYVVEINALYVGFAGYVLEQLGIAHKVDKEAREKLFTGEFEQLEEEKEEEKEV